MAGVAEALKVDVLVAGGGPSGLMLAIELGRRGIKVLVVDEKGSTAFNPQANATQARTMEHYRRLGFSQEVREIGLPHDYPTDIAYFTRYTARELSRFSLPSSSQSGEVIRQAKGSWSAAELPHRVSQKFVEPLLLKHARAQETAEVRFQWRLTDYADKGDHVEATIEDLQNGDTQAVQARFLVGADGARSIVRRGLGIEYTGETTFNREMMGGQMLAVYVRAPNFYRDMPHAKSWMYCAFNTQRRAFMAAVDGKQDFAFHTQVRPGEIEGEVTAEQAKQMFLQAFGKDTEVEVLSHCMWMAGYALVAQSMGRGNVFISGDAAHLFTPAGGLGYNTAVEDAVNLAWKLAAAVKGQAGPALLESYDVERRPLATRNTAFARSFADSMGLYRAPAEIEEEGPAGEKAREEAGAYFNRHSRTEFNIPGITFGGRYDGSPVITADDAPVPPDQTDTYVPTGKPGGRPPHVWLEDGRSLYDLFGRDWTLLRIGADAPDGAGFVAAAEKAGLEFSVVDIDNADVASLYEASLVLIRPDQIIAWRGADDADAAAVLAQVTGWGDAAKSGASGQPAATSEA